MKFGEKLKELRSQKGITQEELAAKIGVTKRTIVGYEAGNYYPRKREVYNRLAEVFGVDQNYLLTEDEEFDAQVSMKYGKRGEDQARGILEQTRELFAGGSLTPEDEIAFIHEIQQIFLDSKERAREKFTPKSRRSAT